MTRTETTLTSSALAKLSTETHVVVPGDANFMGASLHQRLATAPPLNSQRLVRVSPGALRVAHSQPLELIQANARVVLHRRAAFSREATAVPLASVAARHAAIHTRAQTHYVDQDGPSRGLIIMPGMTHQVRPKTCRQLLALRLVVECPPVIPCRRPQSHLRLTIK